MMGLGMVGKVNELILDFTVGKKISEITGSDRQILDAMIK